VVWPSAKAVYALHAGALLAQAYPDQLLKTREMAASSAIPARFLSKILGEMRRAGLISARRGYYGGYALTRPPSDVTIEELLDAVDGADVFAPLRATELAPIPLIDRLRDDLQQLAYTTLRSWSLEQLAERDPIPS